MSQTRASLMVGCCLLVSCSSTPLDSVTLAEEAAALAVAQCDTATTDTAVDTCFTTFEACKAAEGADLEACREALHTCLPPRPHRGPPPGDFRDGGVRPPPPDFDGGRPPPPPPGEGPRARPEGGGHRGAQEIRPSDEAAEACRTSARESLASGAEVGSCREASRGCLQTAHADAFAQRCSELTNECSVSGADATACAAIAARCAEGPRPPPSADGGTTCGQ